MTLQQLINNNQIEAINTIPADARIQIDKAIRGLTSIKFIINIPDFPEAEEMIFKELYDCQRIACMALLTLNGYRAKSSGVGHHKSTIETATILLNGELKTELLRLQKMRNKRNDIEYKGYIAISRTQVEQSLKDAEMVVNKINAIVSSKEPSLPI